STRADESPHSLDPKRGGDPEYAAPPLHRRGARGSSGMQQTVVRVFRQSDLRAVDRDPVRVRRVARTRRKRLALGPPRVEQIERELHGVETELLAHDVRPLLR